MVARPIPSGWPKSFERLPKVRKSAVTTERKRGSEGDHINVNADAWSPATHLPSAAAREGARPAICCFASDDLGDRHKAVSSARVQPSACHRETFGEIEKIDAVATVTNQRHRRVPVGAARCVRSIEPFARHWTGRNNEPITQAAGLGAWIARPDCSRPRRRRCRVRIYRRKALTAASHSGEND